MGYLETNNAEDDEESYDDFGSSEQQGTIDKVEIDQVEINQFETSCEGGSDETNNHHVSPDTSNDEESYDDFGSSKQQGTMDEVEIDEVEIHQVEIDQVESDQVETSCETFDERNNHHVSPEASNDEESNDDFGSGEQQGTMDEAETSCEGSDETNKHQVSPDASNEEGSYDDFGSGEITETSRETLDEMNAIAIAVSSLPLTEERIQGDANSNRLSDSGSEKRNNESIGDFSSPNKRQRRSNGNTDPPSPVTLTTLPVDWNLYMMPIAGNRKARDLIKPYCTSLVQLAKTYLEFENPLSDVHELHLKPIPVTNMAAVYYRVQVYADQNRTKTIKVGSASHFRDRIAFDKKKNEKENIVLAEETYRRILDFDNIGKRFYSFVERKYKDAMETLMTDKSLAVFQRRLAVALHKDGGEKLGAIKKIMLQMLEYGFQLELKTGAPAEFLMYDDNVLQRIYRRIREDMEVVLKALDIRMPHDGIEFFLQALCSWKTGAPDDCYSSEIMTVQGVLGEVHKENWEDAIPVAAVVKAVGGKEIFCENYIPEERASGRYRSFDLFSRLFSDPTRPGIVFADTNEVIFEDDDASPWKNIHDFIKHHWGKDLNLVLNLRDEIWVYKHKCHPHAILVHRPLCVASSSLETISMEQRVNRGLTAGVLCNVQRFCNGLEPLSDDVEYGNIVHAMAAFQVYKEGFHGGLRQAVAVFRHFCRLDNSVNPLTMNRLGKTEGPVPMTLRETNTIQKRKEDRNRTTNDDHKVVEQARRLICNNPNLQGKCASEEAVREIIGPVVDKIIALFQKDNSPDLVKTRLDSLKEHQFEEDSFFSGLIDEHWENHRENSGNSTAAGISNQQITTNNFNVDAWIGEFAPKDGGTKGRTFWIKMGGSQREDRQIKWAENKEKRWTLVDFPGPCKDIFQGELKFESLRERVKPRNRKLQTRHTRATRYPQYGLQAEKKIGQRALEKENQIGKRNKRSYLLVYFVKKKQK